MRLPFFLPLSLFNGGEADQGGDLLARGFSQFRENCQERPGRYWTSALEGLQEVLFLTPQRRVSQQGVEIMVDVAYLLIEGLNDHQNAFPDWFRTDSVYPILFCGAQTDHLLPSFDEILDELFLF
jgi:hypothetical protein